MGYCCDVAAGGGVCMCLVAGAHYSGTFALKRPATVDRFGRKRWVLRCECGNEVLMLEDQLQRPRKVAMKCKICQ